MIKPRPGEKIINILPKTKTCKDCGFTGRVTQNGHGSRFHVRLDRYYAPPGSAFLRVRSTCKECHNKTSRENREHPAVRRAINDQKRRFYWENREAERERWRRRAEKAKEVANRRFRAMGAAKRLALRAPLVLEVVARYYDLTVDEMTNPTTKSRDGNNYAMEARMIAAYLLGPSWGHIGLSDAGRLLNLDHSTVLHHQRRLKGKRGTYEERTVKSECLTELKKLWEERTKAKNTVRRRAA